MIVSNALIVVWYTSRYVYLAANNFTHIYTYTRIHVHIQLYKYTGLKIGRYALPNANQFQAK